MKNNIFNIERFAHVLKKDIVENWKKYLTTAFAIFGSMLLIYMWQSGMDYSCDTNFLDMSRYPDDLNTRYTIYALWMFIFGFPSFMSFMMTPMNSKKKRIEYLSLPASSLEKYLSRLVLSVIGFLLIFFVSFNLVDLIRVGIYKAIYTEMDVRLIDLSTMIGNNDHGALFYNFDFFLICTSYFTLVLSFFVLGTTFWKRNAFIKNIASFVIFSTIIYFFIGSLMHFLSQSDNLNNPFLSPSQFFRIDNTGIIVTACLILTIFNLTLSYFRFKESEIIQKW